VQPAALLDCAGRPRSPATLPGYHDGRPPRNKGLRYPPDPPTVEEIVAVMRAAGEDREGVRLRGLIVVLWRAGLRISEALALAESDLDPDRGSILVRRGKGGRRREVGMDRWAFGQLDPWLEIRRRLPVGSLFCVVRGPTRGRPCSTPAIRIQLRDTAAKARGAPPVRAPSAAPRPRGGDVARGRPAARHPTYQPRGHVRVSAGDRQHRDHPHRPRTPCPGDLRLQRASHRPLNSTAPPPAPYRECISPAGLRLPFWDVRNRGDSQRAARPREAKSGRSQSKSARAPAPPPL
jgi:Phage integrase family